MKPYALLFIVCVLTGGLFVFFASDDVQQQAPEAVSKLKPGTYKVEYDQPDFRGWKAFFVMEVNATGEMEEITFDYINSSGGLKTQDVEYNKRMRSKSGVGPSDYCPRFVKNLRVYQNPDEVDGITGATHSSHDFKDFAQAAFKNAQIGNQSTVYIPQPELVAPDAKEKK